MLAIISGTFAIISATFASNHRMLAIISMIFASNDPMHSTAQSLNRSTARTEGRHASPPYG